MTKPQFRLGQTVYITGYPKTDGRINKGKVVGIEGHRSGPLLYLSEKEYLNDFNDYTYKVAYIDVFTERPELRQFWPKELSTTESSKIES
jgi:hypothetical protein